MFRVPPSKSARFWEKSWDFGISHSDAKMATITMMDQTGYRVDGEHGGGGLAWGSNGSLLGLRHVVLWSVTAVT